MTTPTLNANGFPVPSIAFASAGLYVKTQVFTSATTFTTGATTNSIRARLWGAGGASGGALFTSSASSCSGGGGAGGYGEKSNLPVTPNTTYSHAIGAAGVAGAGAGGPGGDTTLTVGGTTYTAKGGSGSGSASAVATPAVFAGAAGGVAGSNCDVNAAGERGLPGIQVAVSLGCSGNGGSTLIGGGGGGIRLPGATVGNAGTGFGSGGGGSIANGSSSTNGAAGTGGQMIVDEYQ